MSGSKGVVSITALLERAGYTSDPSLKPYAGKRVYRDGVLVGTFHVQTIWNVPGLLDVLREVDPDEADAVAKSIGELQK